MGLKPNLGDFPSFSTAHGIPWPKLLSLLFNEGSGSIVNDLSGNGNQGTNGTGVIWVGEDLYLDGSSNAESILASSIPFTNSEKWSIHFSVKKTGGDHFIGETGASNSNLYLRDNGTIYIYNANGTAVSIANAHIENEQEIITIVCNGTDFLVYRNGKYIGKATPSDNDTSFIIEQIGNSWGDNSPYQGYIRYIHVFPCALTVQQIAYLYRNPWPWFRKDPIELWTAAGAPSVNIPVMIYHYKQSGGL